MVRKISVTKFTTLFFKKRFPEKNIEKEKKYGYFQEWVKRFKDNPYGVPPQADLESTVAIRELKQKYKWY